MRCQVNWKCEPSVSVCHALAALNDGREFVDPTLKKALETQTAKLKAKSLPPSFYQHLVPLSGGQLGNTELARVAGRKSMGSGPQAEIVQRGIDDILAQIAKFQVIHIRRWIYCPQSPVYIECIHRNRHAKSL